MHGGWKKAVGLIGVLCLVAAFWLTYWHVTLERSRGIACIANLRMISTATFRWMAFHDGQTPDSLKALRDRGRLEPKAFICPSSGSEAETGKFVCDYDSLFDRVGHAVSVSDFGTASDIMLVWDKEPFHRSKDDPYRHVLFMDGSIRQLHEAEFREKLTILDRSFPPKEPE